MPIFGAKRLEELVWSVSEIDLDGSDLKRLSDLVGDKLHDLLIIGVRHAGHNNRDVIMEPDLPLTIGLREGLQNFRLYEEELAVTPTLEYLATYPQLEREPSQEVVELLPELMGALIVIVTQLMKVISPDVSNPTTEIWEQVEQALDLTL
jgi:hypothetical protein